VDGVNGANGVRSVNSVNSVNVAVKKGSGRRLAAFVWEGGKDTRRAGASTDSPIITDSLLLLRYHIF